MKISNHFPGNEIRKKLESDRNRRSLKTDDDDAAQGDQSDEMARTEERGVIVFLEGALLKEAR